MLLRRVLQRCRHPRDPQWVFFLPPESHLLDWTTSNRPWSLILCILHWHRLCGRKGHLAKQSLHDVFVTDCIKRALSSIQQPIHLIKSYLFYFIHSETLFYQGWTCSTAWSCSRVSGIFAPNTNGSASFGDSRSRMCSHSIIPLHGIWSILYTHNSARNSASGWGGAHSRTLGWRSVDVVKEAKRKGQHSRSKSLQHCVYSDPWHQIDSQQQRVLIRISLLFFTSLSCRWKQ